MDFNNKSKAVTALKFRARRLIGQKVIAPLISESVFLGSTPASGENEDSHLGSTPAPEPILDSSYAFPTDAKERQKVADKARKEAGIAKRTKKFKIEEVYDDCGTDLSGLGMDAAALAMEHLVITTEDLSDSEGDEPPITDGLELYWFQGSSVPDRPQVQAPHMLWYSSITEALISLQQAGNGDDVVEICGGEARVTAICVRRKPEERR